MSIRVTNFFSFAIDLCGDVSVKFAFFFYKNLGLYVFLHYSKQPFVELNVNYYSQKIY